MRMTKQKRILHEAVQSFGSFFDAIELHRKVDQQGIGIATVYRFLKEAEKKGELHEFLCESRKIYSKGKQNHVHFHCEECGSIKHISLPNADFIKKAPGEVCHFQLDLHGVCKDCKE